MKHLTDPNVTATVALDEANHVRRLYWQPELLKEFIRRHHEVLIIYCTYKTNDYRLPLLHVVGFTCTYQTFSAALEFMDKEANIGYKWMMNGISRTFSQ